jgi:hypothetical protein
VIEQARRSTAFILSYTRVVSPLLSLRYCAHTGKSFLAACFARVSLVRPSWYPGPQDLQATASQLQRRPMPCAVWGCKVRSFQSHGQTDMGHGAVDHPGSFRGLRFEGSESSFLQRIVAYLLTLLLCIYSTVALISMTRSSYSRYSLHLHSTTATTS